MANRVQVKIDASKIHGAFRCNIQGKSSVKECVCIPVETLYQGREGALYVNFIGFEDERRNYGRLYSLKQTIEQSEYNRIRESGELIPFCGDIKELRPQQPQAQTAPAEPYAASPAVTAQAPSPDDDFPF